MQSLPTWAPADVAALYEEEMLAADDRMRAGDKFAEQHEAAIRLALDRAKNGADRARHQRALDDCLGAAPAKHAALEADCREYATLLQRLLTDDRMRPVWQALAKAGNYKGDITHSFMFAAFARRACMWPRVEERWSPAERARWLRDVAALTEKLASKLERTGADDFLRRRYLDGKNAWDRRQARAARAAGKPVPGRQREFHSEPDRVSVFLRSLGKFAEKYLAPASLPRPRDSHARRAYFVRIMAKWFRESLNGPRAELIAQTAVVALGDDSIDVRQVRRLIAKRPDSDDIPKKNPRKRH